MDDPKDPMTQLMDAATQMHEVFKTLQASGFTQWQACRILGVMLAEQGRQE
jgi:hypothetical protein